jgi:hypothetical protein
MKVREVFGSQLIAGCIAQADAITLYPFIFYLDQCPPMTERVHEHIHCNQVRANGWFKFYGSYLWQYVKNRAWLRMPQELAYQQISWEIEAYAHQSDWKDQILKDYPDILTNNPPKEA